VIQRIGQEIPRLALSVLSVMVLVAVCGCGMPAPSVLETEPANGDNIVPVNSHITVSFSQPMSAETTGRALSISPQVNHSSNWSDNDTTLTVIPAQNLSYDTTYTVTIGTEARSQANYPLEETYAFSFTTEREFQPPIVLSTIPTDGLQGAPAETMIDITFSKPMDEEATSKAITISPEVGYEVAWNESKTMMRIKPLEFLKGSTVYHVTVSTEARSQDGLYMEDDYNFSFLTAVSYLYPY